jgi:tetratricopeptide (TPR) repeat protein
MPSVEMRAIPGSFSACGVPLGVVARGLAGWGALAALACGTPAGDVRPAALTFNRDIAPLVWTRCAPCHRPGESAPFSLIEYDEVRSHARQIVGATRGGIMPPWLPAQGYGAFAGERRLTSDEIARLERWVEQGAQEGDARDRKPPPEWPRGWRLGNPDLVIELGEPYTLPESGSDVFRNFVIPIPLDSTRYVRGMEVRPGAAGVVHHATILIDRTGASRRLDNEDPRPGYEGMFSEGARNPESHALGWTPGMTPALDPPGIAWRLDKGSDLVIQLHMIPSGKPEPVRPSVGFYFAAAPPSRMPIDFRLGSKTIDIPAGKADYTIEDAFTLPVDVELLSVYPHAHYRATDMKAWATRPDGRRDWLLWIKQWDFKWQDQYRLAAPMRLEKGTVLSMQFTYDNSAGNPRNPRNPPEPVSYGPQSADEMGDLWLQFLPVQASDAVVLARAYVRRELVKNIASAEMMVARHPRDANWLNGLGARYIEAGRISEGIARLEDAVRLAPDHAEAHHNLGLGLRQASRLAEATDHLRRATVLAPANDRIHYSLATALTDGGGAEEAIRHFRRALAINPDAADTHNDLGAVLASRGLVGEALEHFERALAIRPDYADARKNLELARSLRASQPGPGR